MTARQPRFDELIHFPARLRICGLLRSVEAVSFKTLEDALQLPAPQVSRHLKVLTEAGYVTITKTASPRRSDARRVAWARLTPAGRRALDQHMAALTEIAQGHGLPDARPGPAQQPPPSGSTRARGPQPA